MAQQAGMLLLIIFLAVCTWMDLKHKELSVVWIAACFAAGMAYYILCKPFSVCWMAGGILVGGMVTAVSRWSKGGIGTGDGLVLCVTGVYLGFYDNLGLLFSALLLAAVWGAGSLLLKKAGRKTQIPFLPFLLAAYAGQAFL